MRRNTVFRKGMSQIIVIVIITVPLQRLLRYGYATALAVITDIVFLVTKTRPVEWHHEMAIEQKFFLFDFLLCLLLFMFCFVLFLFVNNVNYKENKRK